MKNKDTIKDLDMPIEEAIHIFWKCPDCGEYVGKAFAECICGASSINSNI
jgi:hypothetical protein